DARRDAARHLLRNEHVGQQRTVRPVLFGRPGWNDDAVMTFEKRFDFRVGHLAEEDSFWFHDAHFTRSMRAAGTGSRIRRGRCSRKCSSRSPMGPEWDWSASCV